MPMTSREMISYLKKNGFEVISQNGSHVKMSNPLTGKTVIVPYHCKDLKKGMEQAILKQGDNMQEAYEMAVDALGLALTSRELEKQVIPAASELSQIAVNKDEYCVIIEFDMLAYKKRTNSKAVKKTLSIPEWLNEECSQSRSSTRLVS